MIPYSELLDQLIEFGLGWMGWTEQEVLFCDMNALQIAYKGRMEMFGAIFGKASPPGPRPPTGGGGKEVKLTPKAFDAMFGGKRPVKFHRKPH